MASLFVDFDGVICDSVDECFVSSWIAFHEHYRGDSPNAVRLADHARFRAMRPFIRSGEDYLLVHELMADGLDVSSQAEFDAAVDRAGWEQMATFRSLLSNVRDDLLHRRLEYWLALHRIYPELESPLRQAAGSPDLYVISTKKPYYIQRILQHHDIAVDRRRIVMPVRLTKVRFIEAVMAERGLSECAFVDDQLDHLRCRTESGVTCYLATWGHASAEALAAPGYLHMSVTELAELLRRQAGAS